MSISTTQELRDDLLKIRQDLREGKISNSVARTLIVGAMAAMKTLLAEMEVAKMGCAFSQVQMHEEDRNPPAKAIRRAA